MWSQIKTEPLTSCSAENFMKAVELVIKKPQVLSKVYCGAQILHSFTFEAFTEEKVQKLLKEMKTSVVEYLHAKELLRWDDIIVCKSMWPTLVLSRWISCSTDESDEHAEKPTFYIQHALPKSPSCPKVVNLFLVERQSMTCIPLLSKSADGFELSAEPIYRIEYSTTDSTCLHLSIWTPEDGSFPVEKTAGVNAIFKRFTHYSNIQLTSSSNQSLQLVNLERYNDLYNELKNKYADFLISNWTEKTDAKKFVYEDIAIATYLLLIFQEEKKELGLIEKQSFLDVGCGNGLLVYLLSSEGHRGTGYDLRKRKIWDWFEGIDLQEKTINPSSDLLFPEYDWLIGNHSDEMTPWIPLISARSGYNKRFFVLPCCPHDFNGKFRERKSYLSVYQAYLDYVEEIVEVCGFEPERDMLKIPSTKRTCILGRRRNYDQSDEEEIDQHRSGFIQFRCERLLTRNGAEATGETAANHGFVPRMREEKVRNCTRLDRDLKSRIVQTVFEKIIAEKCVIEINCKSWNCGASIALGDLIQHFDRETLKQLKKECGGLQTLLKNHHQIFLVVKGQVSLRYGESCRKRTANELHYKTSLCFHHDNHPDGCWQSRDECRFAHGTEDLRKFSSDSSRERTDGIGVDI